MRQIIAAWHLNGNQIKRQSIDLQQDRKGQSKDCTTFAISAGPLLAVMPVPVDPSS
jgi:hypothetical protein